MKPRDRWIRYGLIITLLLLHIGLHNLAGFSFPVPWNDDATFIWPSIAFSQTGSIFTPVMNASRMILIMPPGYMVVTGLILKITGFTYVIGRAVSLFYLLLFFILFISLLRRNGFGNGYLLLACLFLLHPQFILAGNLGRMDTLMLLSVIAGYWLFYNRWYFAGLGMVGCSLLFHPNGIYYLAGLFLYACIQKDSRKALLAFKPRWGEWFIVGGVILSWLGYFYLIGTHWNEFQMDMAMQFRRKLGYSQIPALLKIQNYLVVAVCLFWMVYFGIRKKENGFLLVLGIPGYLACTIGQEIWYGIHMVLFYLVLTLLLVKSGLNWISLHQDKFKNVQGIYLKILLVLILLAVNIRVEAVVPPWKYVTGYNWLGMKIPSMSPYITTEEISRVKEFIYQYHQSHPEASICFLFSGDSLFFADLEKEGIKIRQFFESPVNADLVIDHQTRLRPPWIEKDLRKDLQRFNSYLSPEKTVIYQRSPTNIWYYRVAVQ